jgi:cation diffusion facilitator family transporter
MSIFKISIEKQATLIASVVAFILTILKLGVGLASGSVAVLASAIDSVMDMFVSIFNYFAISKSQQPSDEKFNYGKGKIEALASVIEGMIIMLSGVFLLYASIKKYFYNESSSYLDVAIIVMAISLIITFFLVLYLNYVAKKTNNMVIKADALHYKTDLYANGVVLISLFIVSVTNIELADVIAGSGISIWIIYSAYELIKDGILILLDIAVDDCIVNKIESIIDDTESINSFHWLKTRQAGNNIFVDVHLVFDDANIKLIDAHTVGDTIEDKIALIDTKINWVINIHLDPHDDS